MIDQVDDHRDAQRIGQQDELLPGGIARMPGGGGKVDALKPFRLGQLHLFDERMEMTRQAEHDLAQPRIRRALEAAQPVIGNVVFSSSRRSLLGHDHLARLPEATLYCLALCSDKSVAGIFVDVTFPATWKRRGIA